MASPGKHAAAAHLRPRPQIRLLRPPVLRLYVPVQPHHQQVGAVPRGAALQQGKQRGEAVAPDRLHKILGLRGRKTKGGLK